jgi:hypothetical protein
VEAIWRVRFLFLNAKNGIAQSCKALAINGLENPTSHSLALSLTLVHRFDSLVVPHGLGKGLPYIGMRKYQNGYLTPR